MCSDHVPARLSFHSSDFCLVIPFLLVVVWVVYNVSICFGHGLGWLAMMAIVDLLTGFLRFVLVSKRVMVFVLVF